MHTRIIDTHVHVWDFNKAAYDWLKNDTSILHRNYAVDEINEARKEAQVVQGVLVQAANNLDDTDWMLQVAAGTDWIAGVVGWLPLIQPVEAYEIFKTKYQSHKYFKGIRHLIHDEPDPRWLLHPEVIESLQMLSSYQLPFDIVGILPVHIETALEVCEKVSQLRMVFDHCNQPPIAKQEKFGQWGELMKAASLNSNFFVKISGLGTTCGSPHLWNEKNIAPYIEFILEHFGVNRCFCGSDWPVSLLTDNYNNTWTVYKNVLSSLLTEEEQERVFYGNAKAFYDL